MATTFRRLLHKQRPAASVVEPPIESSPATWYETRRPRQPVVGLPRELLNDAAQVAGVEPRWRSMLDDPAIVAAIERDDVPIPHVSDREGYYPNNHLNYWLSGAANLQTIRNLIPATTLGRVLDFGGASGRLARHLALADDVEQVTIAELSLDHVHWVNEHFGPKVRPVKVCPQPHFPLADRSITLCVGISVFTHIDEQETGWLAEINRVLTDGGWAFLTVHTEYTWPLMLDAPPQALAEDPEFQAHCQPGKHMPAERIAFHYKPGTRYHCCNTFMTTDYLRRTWSRWFEVCGIHAGAHNRHAVAVLRKMG